MKVYEKQIKGDGRGGYWGDFGKIDMGWSYAEISKDNPFPGEKHHYHKVGTMYFLALEGSGILEVKGKKIELVENSLLRIDPGEKYKVIGAKNMPFRFIAVCTSKDPEEKIVIE